MARTVDYTVDKKRARYPWSEWADGSNWLVVGGEDYHVSSASFRRVLNAHATAYGMTVDIEYFDVFPEDLNDHGEGFVFRFNRPAKKKLKRR